MPRSFTKATILSCAFWCKRGSRTIPPFPTSDRCSSNCGLISARITPSGFSKSNAFAQDQGQGNERNVDRANIDKLLNLIACEESRIDFFENDHAWIVAKFPVKLAVADIYRVNLFGAALEHAIGKPAG